MDQASLDRILREKGFVHVAGVDEAGRGPLAGPVVAAAVIIPRGLEIDGVNDSKKLTPEEREEVFEEIASLELPVAIGIIDNETIDCINILRASLMAMRRALSGLDPKADCALVDGTVTIPKITTPQMTIVHGDAKIKSIGAASIVAKVTRDRIMERYAETYKHFAFDQHFGYPTPKHLAELKKYGPTQIHRRSFRPVAEALEKSRPLPIPV
ncbi:MAG: ribonuclease HII [candidate division Zixibacteria bacterium]|nr:ribonuclease HII [candidate division Zixibacteria bacterium]